MNFKKFLNENDEKIKNWFESLKKDCKYFLSTYKNKTKKFRDRYYTKDMFLLRGDSLKNNFGVEHIRKDRKSLDMPKIVHNFINDFFEKKFGKKIRSETLFATFSQKIASDYGNKNFIIIPKGKFSFYFSDEIGDLYVACNRVAEKIDHIVYGKFDDMNQLLFFKNKKILNNFFDKLKEELETYKKYSYDSLYSKEMAGELMIDCDEFYYISIDEFEKFFVVENNEIHMKETNNENRINSI